MSDDALNHLLKLRKKYHQACDAWAEQSVIDDLLEQIAEIEDLLESETQK